METILKRFSEPSSWAGLTGILGMVGVSLSEQLAGQITIVLAGIFGLVSIILKEKGDK